MDHRRINNQNPHSASKARQNASAASKKESRFYGSLRDIFIGAKVEGDSGYINLMRIKSRYYEQGVFPRLQADINKSLEPFPEFREELFDKLYTFFSRYFSEIGTQFLIEHLRGMFRGEPGNKKCLNTD